MPAVRAREAGAGKVSSMESNGVSPRAPQVEPLEASGSKQQAAGAKLGGVPTRSAAPRRHGDLLRSR